MNDYTIKGAPRSLKNSKQVFRGNRGKPFITSSNNAKKAMSSAIRQLISQNGAKSPPIAHNIAVKFTFYLAKTADSGSLNDLSNLFELPQDALTRSNIIIDDRIICSLDGSRRVTMCDTCNMRQKYKVGAKKGTYKKNCGAVKKCTFERTDIEITQFIE